MNGLKDARLPIRDLVKHLEYRSTFGRPVYIKRNTQYAALIVPSLRNGTDGPYEYLKAYQRATVHEAIVLGFVRLGGELMDIPRFAIAGKHWCADPGLMGRTISLTEVPR